MKLASFVFQAPNLGLRVSHFPKSTSEGCAGQAVDRPECSVVNNGTFGQNILTRIGDDAGAQYVTLVGISEETFRYWRKELPPLKQHKGHSPSFSASDICALLIVKEVIQFAGGKVSLFAPVALQVFEACDRLVAPGHDSSLLIITPNSVSISSATGPLPIDDIPVFFVVPIRPIIAHLRASIGLGLSEQSQLQLPLGPVRLK